MSKETENDNLAKRLISFVESGEYSTELASPVQKNKENNSSQIKSLILDKYGVALLTSKEVASSDKNGVQNTQNYNPRNKLSDSVLRTKLLHYYFETVIAEFPNGIGEIFFLKKNQNAYKTITLKDISPLFYMELGRSSHFSVDIVRHFDEYNSILESRTYHDQMGIPLILKHMSRESLSFLQTLLLHLQNDRIRDDLTGDTPFMFLVKAELKKRTPIGFIKEIGIGFNEGLFDAFKLAKNILKFPFTLPTQWRQFKKKDADIHE